jgi:hypothetical protein
MRSLSRLALTCSCIALLTCGPGGIAASQAATSATGSSTALPAVTVDAPNQTSRRSKPIRHPVAAHRAVPRQSSPANETSVTAILGAPTSVMTKLAKLESMSGSCVDGCQTSFRTGNAPWRGCSASGWPALSGTCRNVYHFKTYAECSGTGLLLGWQSREITWYCTSLALK